MIQEYEKQSRNGIRIIRLIRIVRVLKLFEEQKLTTFKDQLQDFIANQTYLKIFLQILQLYFMIMTFSHWVACILHYVRQYEIQLNELNVKPYLQDYNDRKCFRTEGPTP